MIREATPDDALSVATVHVRAWREAYAGLLPAWYLEGLRVERRATGWERLLENGCDTVLLHHTGPQLAGFACIGACRDGDASEDRGEVSAFYYLREHRGRGLAPRLLEAARARPREDGYRVVTLRVLRGNGRAIAFYRKAGFGFDGAEKTDVRRGFALHEVRLRAPAGGAAG